MGKAIVRKPILLIVVAIASCALIGGAGVAGASKAKKTAIYDLFGGKMVKPEEIFLTANSGPYLTDLEWFKWGKEKATGVGTYVSDCASCPGPDRRPAIVRLSKRDECKAKGGFAYKRGRLTTGADNSGEEKTISIPTGYDFCKPGS